MDQWWHEHGGNHESPQWAAFIEAKAILIATKHDELLSPHDNAGCFGMSKAGGCTRSAGLKWLGHKGEPFTGSTRWVFQCGHDGEVNVLATLTAMGYPVLGTQAPARIEPFMHSFSDGLLEEFERKRTVVGVKTAGYKMSGRNRDGSWKRYGFAQLPLDGVLAAQPGHYAQAQAEMHAHGAEQFLYIAAAKDMIAAMKDDPIMKESGSLAFYVELIPYNKPWVTTQLLPTWDAQWADVQAGEPGEPMFLNGRSATYVKLPKPGSANKDDNKDATGSYNACVYCDLRAACPQAAKKEQAA